MTIKLILLLFLSAATSRAQFDFLPQGTHIPPLRAGFEEPRVGLFKFSETGRMIVDVGNSIDVFGYDIPGEGIRMTAGIDFLAYAFTTGAQGLRLQIDAVDGFFGGNYSISKSREGRSLQARLRILHHSAHFADGHYIAATRSWIDGREPLPFTRDFGELTLLHVLTFNDAALRFFGSASYAALVRPDVLRRWSGSAGGELYYTAATLFGKPANLYGTYAARLDGSPVYAASHQVQAGVKFGTWYGKGPSLFVAWYSGRNPLGEYFDERISTVGAGFTVDFF